MYRCLIPFIIVVFSFYTAYAQDIWGNWSVAKINTYLTNNSPRQLQEGYYQSYPGDEGDPAYRNTSSSNAVLSLEIPLILRLTPLKPFQLEFSMSVESGIIDVSLNGESNLGNRIITKQCERLGLYRSWSQIVIEYDLQSTLTLKYKHSDSSTEFTVGQILNCKSIGSISFTFRQNACSMLLPRFNYRQMTFGGIEQETLRLANSYANRGDFVTAKAVLDHYIDDFQYQHSYEVFIMRAICNAELDNMDSVIKDATSAISLKPNSCEYAYFIRGVAKLENNDFSGVSDLRLAGHDGRKYMLEHNLSDYNISPSVNGNIMATPQNILSTIIPSKKTISLTPKQIYNKYNNSVFMIYTQGLEGTSQGSGFFIGKNGLAISNYHVFEGAIRGKEQVKLMNGGTYQVKEILGYDKERDYIIFRVEGSGFSYIPITKRGYEIGDEVFAIGSPKGMQNTLSNGLVSQRWDDTKFQISVPIDHGSSGGALINQYGEVIGITSGGRDDTHANLNYAIDIRTIFNQNE